MPQPWTVDYYYYYGVICSHCHLTLSSVLMMASSYQKKLSKKANICHHLFLFASQKCVIFLKNASRVTVQKTSVSAAVCRSFACSSSPRYLVQSYSAPRAKLSFTGFHTLRSDHHKDQKQQRKISSFWDIACREIPISCSLSYWSSSTVIR